MKHNDHEDNFDSWLTRELRASQPYLEDDGFSDRVMHAVPASSASRRRPWFWSLLLALMSVLVILWLFPGWGWLATLLSAFLTLPLTTLLLVGLGVSLGMTAMAGIILWQSGDLKNL